VHGVDLFELGLVILGLAVLARVAARFALSTVPVYLLAGLAIGRGGVLPLVKTEAFIRTGAELGLIILLFLLGLEYTARELTATLRSSRRAGLLDLVLNFPPGFLAGLLLGWGPVPAAFLGGVTYVSSSGIAAKLLHDLGGMGRPETAVVLSILVIEDLAMALYLPVLAVLLAGGVTVGGLATAAGALVGVAIFLLVASRVDVGISRFLFNRSDEALLLTILGFALVVAGIAELGSVSAAVGALLAGIAISGPAAHSAKHLLAPLRDLFAAIFFAFVGFGIDPASLPRYALPAVALAAVTGATKFLTGWWSARRIGVDHTGSVRTGATLVARGEFSIVIAGLAATGGLLPDLASLAVTYVLIMAVAGPVLSRLAFGRRPGPTPSPVPDQGGSAVA
jgi:CPA2 family monovalent cation:H+ antiporter-2